MLNFPLKEYMEKLEAIRQKKLISRIALIKEIGFDYNTLRRLESGKGNVAPKTLRRLRDFVDKNEKEL